MGVYGSLYDYIIHVALIVTSPISLSTSFQPPLVINKLVHTHLHSIYTNEAIGTAKDLL